ncbi:MAG: hypothetical protein IJE78_05015 [Bacteroidaceae bacterium]|nr:hypothetical protein [Bacteroidaceae bacterium]
MAFIQVHEGDKFILNSVNGRTYELEVVNVNICRPPDMIYACNIRTEGEPSYYECEGDYYFCGDEVLYKCTKVCGETDEKEIDT